MGWLAKLKLGLDYRTGRFEAFLVENEEDRAACLSLLEQVRRQELRRVYGENALESAAFAGQKVESYLFACRDTRTGEIVGCTRGTPAAQMAHLPASREEYHLDRIPEPQLERTAIATRLVFKREYRKTAGSLVLLEKMYSEALHLGFRLCLLTCEPGLYALYSSMGFRPLGRVHAGARGGFRVPMVLVMHDRDYLHRVGSPLASALKRYDGPLHEDGVRFWIEHERRFGAIDIGLSRYDDDDADVHRVLTEGMSSRGVAEVLQNAHLVECIPGHVVIAEGDGGRCLFIVERGLVEVEIGGRVVALVGRGELLGEAAMALDSPRTAMVRAASDDTRILVLSQSAPHRLSDAEDRAILWRNVARVLAQRLVLRSPTDAGSPSEGS